MTWLKKNLTFTVIMVLLAGVLGFETYLILGQRATARQAQATLQQKVDEFGGLANKSVLPHTRNVELTRAEIRRQRDELELFAASMRGREGLKEDFIKHPTTSTNAVFDIEFFVQEYRLRTVAATEMKEEDLNGEYFGFAAYATTGPDESLLASVYKQRLIVAHILDRLFEARPVELISIQRPGEAGAAAPVDARRGDRQQQTGGGAARLNPQLTAAIPDIAETMPFEVVFTGRASTLRAFLNELAAYEMPLIVRSVEVAAASENAARGGAEPSGRRQRRAPEPEPEAVPQPGEQETESKPADDRILLVAADLSRFTVAMEYVDLLPLERAR